MSNKIYVSILAAALFPVMASAEVLGNTNQFARSILSLVTGYLIPLVFALALLYFLWGVAKYIRSVSPGSKEEGKTIMIWGVVALFVMSSVWGLVRFLQEELIPGRSNTSVPVPNIEGYGGRSSGGGGGSGLGDI